MEGGIGVGGSEGGEGGERRRDGKRRKITVTVNTNCNDCMIRKLTMGLAENAAALFLDGPPTEAAVAAAVTEVVLLEATVAAEVPEAEAAAVTREVAVPTTVALAAGTVTAVAAVEAL